MAIGSASAAVVKVETFDGPGLGHGTLLNGIGIATVTTDSNGSVDQAVLFDTTKTGTQDPDLEGPHQRKSDGSIVNLTNVVIISENKNFADPDDEARGGTVTFDFRKPVDLVSIDFADTKPGASVDIFDSTGTKFTFTLRADLDTNRPQNFMETLFFGAGVSNAVQMVVRLPDSGAFDNLAYSEVPVPAGFVLMLTGAAFLARRKR